MDSSNLKLQTLVWHSKITKMRAVFFFNLMIIFLFAFNVKVDDSFETFILDVDRFLRHLCVATEKPSSQEIASIGKCGQGHINSGIVSKRCIKLLD